MSSYWKTGALVLLCAQPVGCKDDPSSSDGESTGPEPTTSGPDDPTTETLDPETTAPDDPTTESESSVGPDTETTTIGETETESETETTGGPLACVNEDIGSAVGENVLSGSTAADDTDLVYTCVGKDRKAGSGFAPDYIVSWTAPAAGDYTFSLVGSDYDTGLGIFDGDCNGPELACNDDCGDLASVLGVTVEADQVVLVAITGYGGLSGNFELSIAADVAPDCEGFETETDATVSTTDPTSETDPTGMDASTVTETADEGGKDGGDDGV